MSSRASPYRISSRRKASRTATPDGEDEHRRKQTAEELTLAQHTCLQIQDAIERRLSPAHCRVSDVSCGELQYRLLGAKRYWLRSIKQEKTGAMRWEARCYEVTCRKSTLERLRCLRSWHQVARLPSEDVQIQSLGMFGSEKQATQAFESAFQVRDRTSPLTGRTTARAGSSSGVPLALCTQFQMVIVSEAFARLQQRQRLALVYETLLEAFPVVPDLQQGRASHIRGFSYVGSRVASFLQWRSLPFHLTVVAKTPTQWKALNAKPVVLSDTERYGLSHLENDRALNVDLSVLPMARGLVDLLSISNNQQDNPQSKLPHFYHGLPDDLKRMITEEHTKATDAFLSHSSTTPSTTRAKSSFLKLTKNSEATFLPKYTKRGRELIVAATRLQRLFRRRAQCKTLRWIFRRHRAALRIQQVFRGFRDRVYVTAYRRVMNCASTIVQAVFRSYTSRLRTKRLRAEMTSAALQIERVYRGHVGRKYVRWVRQMESSAIQMERVVRGFMARRRTQRLARAKYKRVVITPAVVRIQRVWRGFMGRQIAKGKKTIHIKLTVLDPAALRIERLLRGFLARRLASRYRKSCASASVIQKHWRSYRFYCKWMALMEYRRQDKMASKIGALGRGYVARQFYRREKRRIYLQCVVRPAAVHIQRVFRGYLVRKQHEDIRDRVEAAITLQQMWHKRSRIKTIQAKLRGFREAIRHARATQIQYWYRCCRARETRTFLKAQQRARHGRAALAIQCAWRSHCSRTQLVKFRFCARIERKAQALTQWKEKREDIEFDSKDARADLKRIIKYKAKSLRRIKELKEMRLDWERRQPVVEKELAELTQEDLDRGWGEAFQTEKHVLRFTLELSVEDIAGRKEQIREYDTEIEDLRLELEDLERDLEECILDETMELETYRDMEVQTAQKMFTIERERKIRLQKVRWGVRSTRQNVILRTRDDLRLVEKEVLATRQVQELGALGFERKQLLKAKVESAIEQIVQDRAKQSQVMMEMRRDAHIVTDFDDAIQRMSKMTSKYAFEYRMPKADMREREDTPMCDGCGRLTCDCDELEAKRVAAASSENTGGSLAIDLKSLAKTKTTVQTNTQAKRATNYGHPLRRKRNYQQNES